MSIDEKCCCAKEPVGYVPITRIIDKIDALAAVDDSEGIERTLRYWEQEARTLGDRRGLLEILSEEIGFFRRADREKEGLATVSEALEILLTEDVCSSVAYATIYLNCATTLKAFGRVEEAMPHYLKAKEIYEKLLSGDDYRLAGLYNNYATALADLKRFDEAKELYLKAIAILRALEDSARYAGEIAISYVNLAQLVYEATYDDGMYDFDGVEEYLTLAKAALDKEDAVRDAQYASACRKCAQAFGFYGYFAERRELEKRAENIYRENANK